MKKNCAIIGSGSWGTAIAVLLARQGYEVNIYSRRKKQVKSMKNKRINIDYFPEIELPKNIYPTNNLDKCVKNCKYIFITVPTSSTEEIAIKLNKFFSGDEIVISTAKGIEIESFRTNSQILSQYLEQYIAVLSGPTHAEEVIHSLPTAAVVASKIESVSEELQKLISDKRFRLYVNKDLKGIELGGALKNIIAVAAGISDGLGYGDNARAALITRGLAEISRLGEELDSNKLTFSGLSGLGDLIVTCNSSHSRNRTFGYKIGEGKSVSTAQEEVGQVVEGIKTAKAVFKQLESGNISIEMPITKAVYKVIFKNKEPLKEVDDLMTRTPKFEI